MVYASHPHDCRPLFSQVQFNPSQDYGAEFGASAAVQRHFTAVAVRVRLVQPSDTEPLSSYYAVADLEVDGQCSCFGHASVCVGEVSARMRSTCRLLNLLNLFNFLTLLNLINPINLS